MAKLRGDFVVLQREEYRRLLARADDAQHAASTADQPPSETLVRRSQERSDRCDITTRLGRAAVGG
jgi:hypothetical protein